MGLSIEGEKMIKGIQECDLNGGLIGNCPYKGILLLLKEQEPHVLSHEEMIEAGKNHDAVYVEQGVGRCFWGLAVEGIDPPEDKLYNYPGGVLFNVVDADNDMWDGDFYLMCDVYPEKRPHPMGWRAWNMKPTPEQMKEVKW